MSKDRRSSSCRCRVSPYSGYNKNDDRRPPKCPVIPIRNEKEYEEARCPICMEHPHNAVLLLCSSHDKGCRTYMCDTSSRHSNCLDQFRKSTTTMLVCPLCRGEVNGWTVVNPARQFMNSRTRNCSLDTCDFTGDYSQLREHARRVHPRVRPTDIDPDRELEWRILEEDMVHQDMLNMQFEFDEDDDADEYMDGVSDVASPIWDHDYSVFFGSFESDFENVVSPELDSASDDTSMFLNDFDSYFDYYSAHESERFTFEPLVGRSRGNAQTTRSRTPTRQSSNSQPSPQNRQEQVTALDDFDSMFDYLSAHESERTTYEPLVGRSRGNARTTRSRTPIRQSSNSQPSSQNRQEQVTALEDFDSMFDYLSAHESERIAHEPFVGRPRRRARTTSSRTPTRQRSNRHSSSHNRQEQATTLADFHELSSNLP